MRHRVDGKRLGRSSGHRRAMRRNLISDLFRYERIRTTKAKAASVRGASEKLITLAKHADDDDQVHARRMVAKRIGDPAVVMKLFDEIAPRYVERPGGYTRVLKLGPRKGDGAEMVLLELVEE